MEDKQPSNNEQTWIAIEKYISILIIDFKEHLEKYNSVFSGICANTNTHFDKFSDLIKDYSEEIRLNQIALYEMISKFSAINDEWPRLEEFYYKVKEMRAGLDKWYKELSKDAPKWNA